jgi:hypothetical protein
MKVMEVFQRIGESAPGLSRAAGLIAGAQVQKLLGFWLMWHIAGGLEPLIARRWLSRAGVYAQRALFRRVMGVEVENFWPEAVAFMVAERERRSL